MEKEHFKVFSQKLVRQKQRISLIGAIFAILILDLTIASYFPFWLTPIFIGFIIGLIIGTERAGIYAGLGGMIGRLISLIVLLITVPNLPETLNIFIATVGDFLDISLPQGTLVICTFSIIIAGLYTALGGICGGSVIRLLRLLRKNLEVDPTHSS
ncbi:MAG: hypothetical protein ACXADY_10160 [Candidatus Hodarchaeales archaeon]